MMFMIIFFGGILLGFFMGFSSMALLSAMNYRLECQKLQEARVYQSIPPHQRS